MDDLGGELLDFLATGSLKEARRELYNLLNVRDDEVNVYYLLPLSNLKSIIADGGIKCKKMVKNDITDLSAHCVQDMRDKTLSLAQKVSVHEKIIDKKIHECVNFFWNPLNDTFFAFQRNSLLIDADIHDDTYGIVCIIEMRLSAFFESEMVYWCTSNKNLASFGHSTFSKREYYENMNWQSIFSLQTNRNRTSYRDFNQTQSAEFVVFYENLKLTISDLIPTQFIKRILVPAQYEPTIKETLQSVQNQIYPLENSKVFKSKAELLRAEKNLIKTIYNLQKLGLSTEDFCELINTFSNYSKQLGCSLDEKYFETNYMAHAKHGIGHVTRVMFWSHILCHISCINQQLEKATLYAAFIHDFCRIDNCEEKEHGTKAARKYENFLIDKQISDNLMNCMNAVIYHCKDDNECPDKDLIWAVLKDADSLDRGRFGHPNRFKSKGCDINCLRLDILRNSPKLAEQLAWLAYWVATITKHTEWSKDTFMDIKKVIVVSLKTSLRNDILNIEERLTADKMFRHLSVS